uniref:DNA helicase MCM8 n=1 Tax=Phallusia mammillata TaxID=59560 RepID=A0A6F9DL39_9ASCI|nr:DNA helicase MCM8 [Phallusia mammillata]
MTSRLRPSDVTSLANSAIPVPWLSVKNFDKRVIADFYCSHDRTRIATRFCGVLVIAARHVLAGATLKFRSAFVRVFRASLKTSPHAGRTFFQHANFCTGKTYYIKRYILCEQWCAVAASVRFWSTRWRLRAGREVPRHSIASFATIRIRPKFRRILFAKISETTEIKLRLVGTRW